MRRSLSDSMYYGYLLLLLFLHIGQVVQGSGFFELQILQISNSRGELANGACCGSAGSPVPRDRSLPCPRQCNTFFRVCLKEYQSNVTSTGSCSFGNTSSPVLGGNSFALADPDRSNGKLVLPFSFRWTRSFTLILQAVDYDNSTNPPSNHVIDEATYSGIILPSTTWHTLNCEGNTSRITYRVRVQCDLHYFNHTCTKFCRPRDDKFGHYVCDVNGDKECITGWRGTNCEIAECKKGCHPIHGKCDQPGGCECRPGWRGEFCDQCTPYPGCKHGYCNGSSWQCICDTNWGGILCDQDLNTCGSQEPCENGGTCENTAPDQYMCTCPEGFSGLNCNVVDNPCATAPCGNSGTCQVVNGQYHCTCTPGWTGKTCHDNIDECASAPCQNGGTCKDMVNSFHCICPSEWEGSACQFDADECLTNPCINAHSCHNLVGDYRCNCQEGWTGKNCDQNINDCIDRCQHGATCIDLVNDYHCACQPGYTGRDCHTDINECESNPCQNGGECSDQQNGYRCICPVGFLGERCEVENDHCTPNPCQNAAPCFNTQADYYCHCPEEWEGKNCSTPRINCDNPPCDDINDCQVNPCLNGGTCVDKINSFRCICKDGWEGNTCNITKSHACRSDPCQNGATCVNKGDDYSCICKEGYEGQHCELDINDCSSAPCYNGGKCVDGVNWFLCECAEGFTGANCRINVNDCASNPCGFGSTCVDGIGEFRCICPPGRKGVRCEQVEETDIPRGECVWNGQRFARNSTVEDDCNICTCVHTGVKCTQVWCGLGNCLGSPNLMHGTVICHLNQVCVPSPREACLTPNCAPWGECRDLESGKRVGPPLLPAPPSCWPNQAELSNSCARLTLLLDRSKLPQGVSTEGLCVELRRLVAIHQSHTGGQDKLILLCDLKQGYNDTIEVTMSSLSTTSGSEENKAVTEGIRVLGELISRKQTNLSALMSIVEVNVDTALISEELPGNGYLIALICVILIILCVAGIGGLYYWHHYSRRRHGTTGGALGASGPGPCHRHHDDEKSNNLQNEENLRRYANPLKDEVSPGLATSLGSIRGSTAKPSTAESAVDLQTPRVSVVRPLGSGESPAGEMLEMLAEPEVAPGKVVASSSSEPGLHPTHRNSQILLFKAQNPDVRKNTAAFDDTSAHKDFAKRIINLKVLPPVQRTLQPSQVDRGGEVLTVIV